MKKKLAVLCFGVCCAIGLDQPVSFVQQKKTVSEKPSQIKENIVVKLENILTRTSDLIASIAQEQHLIVEKVHDVLQSQGVFAQSNPQKLSRHYEALVKMEQELVTHHVEIQKQFKKLEKDFSERL